MTAVDRAVVVGAGHNGLVAACYLARDGLDVEVVERDTVVGGAVSTVERFPGYRMDRGSSAHIMVRHTGIVEDLDLTAVGLEYQDLDPWGFAPFGDERHPLLRRPRPHLRLDRAGLREQGRRRLPGVRPRLVGPQRPRLRGLPGRPDDDPPRPHPVGRREVDRPRRPRAVAAVPHLRRQPARRALRRRAAQDGAGLDGRAVRAADPRGGHRRPRRVEHRHAPQAPRPPQGRQRHAQRRAAAPPRVVRRTGAPGRRRRRDHDLRWPRHRCAHRLGRAPGRRCRGRRLPRPHHRRAARRGRARRPRRAGAPQRAHRQRHRHGGPARHDRAAHVRRRHPRDRPLDAAHRPEPAGAAPRARRVQRRAAARPSRRRSP